MSLTAVSTFRQVADLMPRDVPDELDEARVHLGAPITLHFGCEDGEPFCRETSE
jgi:hypothetical protein